jgi:hypothetical protein
MVFIHLQFKAKRDGNVSTLIYSCLLNENMLTGRSTKANNIFACQYSAGLALQ